MSETVTMTTEQVLFTGLTGCISAIVFLFGLEMKHHGETKEQLVLTRSRLDKCESDRTELHIRVALLEEKLKHEHGN